MSSAEPYSAYGLGIQGMVRDGQASAADVAAVLHARVAERHLQREKAEAQRSIPLAGRWSATTHMCKPFKALRAAFQVLPRSKPSRIPSATTSCTVTPTTSSTGGTSAAGDKRFTPLAMLISRLETSQQSRTETGGPRSASQPDGLGRALAYLSRRIKAGKQDLDSASAPHDAAVQMPSVITVGKVSHVYTSLELAIIYIAHNCSGTLQAALQAALSTTFLRWPRVCAPYFIICAFQNQLRHVPHGYAVLFSAAVACGMTEADATLLTRAAASRSHSAVRDVAPLPQLNLPSTGFSAIPERSPRQPALFNESQSSSVDIPDSLSSSPSANLPASYDSRPTGAFDNMAVEEKSISSGATSAEMASLSGASTGGTSAHMDPTTKNITTQDLKNSTSISDVGCWEEPECAGVEVAQEGDNTHIPVSLSLPLLWRASASPTPSPMAYAASSRPSIFCSASPSSAASMWYRDGVWHEQEKLMVMTTACRRRVGDAGDGHMEQSGCQLNDELSDAVSAAEVNRRAMESLRSLARESNLVIRRDGKVLPMLDMSMIPQGFDAGDLYGTFSPLPTCSYHAGDDFAAPTPSVQRNTGSNFFKLFCVNGNRGCQRVQGQRRGDASTKSCISDVTMGHDLDPTCWNFCTTWWWNFVHGGFTSESLASLQYEVHVVDAGGEGRMGSIRLQQKKVPKKTKGIKAIPRRIRRALLRATLACSDAAVAVSSAIGNLYLSLPSLRPHRYEEPPTLEEQYHRFQLYKHWQQYAAEAEVEEQDGGAPDVDDCEYSY